MADRESTNGSPSARQRQRLRLRRVVVSCRLAGAIYNVLVICPECARETDKEYYR